MYECRIKCFTPSALWICLSYHNEAKTKNKTSGPSCSLNKLVKGPFVKCFSKVNIKILDRLDNLSKQVTNPIDISEIVCSIETLFVSTSGQTFGEVKSYSVDSPTKKRWFNKECKVARKKYHYSKKKYNNNKSQPNKILLKKASIEYKQIMSKNVKMFKNSRVEKLKKLKTANPRECWKIINSVDRRLENCMTILKQLTVMTIGVHPRRISRKRIFQKLCKQ